MEEDKSTNGRGTDLPAELVKADGEQRPRSLLDLIDLKVLDVDLAAWLVSHISRGASLIVGSGPGGVGKSTTMRALMAFAPGHLPFAQALPEKIGEIGETPSCVVSNELSDHPPPTYLWGQDLREFFALEQKGHMLVGNMHADDLSEVREQICAANEVPEQQFWGLRLFAFIKMEGADPNARRIKDTTSRRYFTRIFYSDGASAHQTIFSAEGRLDERAPRDAQYEALCRAFLQELLAGGARTIEEVRRLFLVWEKEQLQS